MARSSARPCSDRARLAVACALVAASCGGAGEVADATGPFLDAGAGEGGTDLSTIEDAAADASYEDPGSAEPGGPDLEAARDSPGNDESSPVWPTCGPGEACNAWPHADGTCPGRCLPQTHAMTCKGQVANALCHRLPVPDFSNAPVQWGPILVTPEEWPDQARVGEAHPVRVSVQNTGPTPVSLPFSFKHPDTWDVVEANFVGLDRLDLAPGQVADLDATVRAVRPDVLEPYGGIVLSLFFADQGLDVHGHVVFGPEEPIHCGGLDFPEQWCPDGNCSDLGHFYVSARCCDGVFYPGAQCCGDADCIGGSCVDGHCLYDIPTLGSANTLPVGNQRILLVLVDSEFQVGPSACADRADEVRKVLPLDETTAYLREVVRKRVLRDLLDLRWTVLAGFASSDFIHDGNYLFPDYMARLDEYLKSLGCEPFDAYDKVIVASPTMDLQGFGGQAMMEGRIAVLTAANPYLLAHELAHTFGASDLYLDLGGQFQYQMDLMGNNLGGFGPPEDGVMWGEMGLGDVDQDGVVDLAQVAAFPEALEIETISATLTPKHTLEIAVSFGGRENGVLKRVVVPSFHLELPEFGADRHVLDPRRVKFVVFDEFEVDLAALAGAEAVEVRLVATLSFTSREWKRVTRTLDRTITVPVGKTRAGG